MTDQWRKLFDEARHENGKNNSARAAELMSLAIQAAVQISSKTRSYSSAQGIIALWYFNHERYDEAEAIQRSHIKRRPHTSIRGLSALKGTH